MQAFKPELSAAIARFEAQPGVTDRSNDRLTGYPYILVEVNDDVVNIYMHALVANGGKNHAFATDGECIHE